MGATLRWALLAAAAMEDLVLAVTNDNVSSGGTEGVVEKLLLAAQGADAQQARRTPLG